MTPCQGWGPDLAVLPSLRTERILNSSLPFHVIMEVYSSGWRNRMSSIKQFISWIHNLKTLSPVVHGRLLVLLLWAQQHVRRACSSLPACVLCRLRPVFSKMSTH